MNPVFNKSLMALSLTILFSGPAIAGPEGAGAELMNEVTQENFLERAMTLNPEVSAWIKPEPGLAYRIPADPNQIPRAIYNNVGTIDDINKWIKDPKDHYKSLNEYFAKSAGSVINLQYASKNGVGTADFYAIGANTWKTEYVEAAVGEAKDGNQKLVGNLSKIEGMADLLASNDPNLLGVKKISKVYFVRASALGYSTREAFTVPKPEWGAGQSQSKPANEDAFVRFEVSKNASGEAVVSSYIVNSDCRET